MANPEHIQWLLEGVDAWNARRTEDIIYPDFAGVDFFKEFDDAGKVEPGDNPGSFVLPSLAGVNLSSANLCGAFLIGLDLSNANFSGAYLRNACLVPNNLVGANFFAARPWQANLHFKAYYTTASPEVYPEEQAPVEVVRSIPDLLVKIQRIKSLYQNHHEEVAYYFRGEPSTEWELRPSVARNNATKENEGEMLRSLMSRRPDDFRETTTALSQWVLAQHHKLNTRFLDVTKNPLVALFFACESSDHTEKAGRLHIFAVPKSLVKPYDSDTISVIANFAKLTRPEKSLLLGKRDNAVGMLGSNSYHGTIRRLYQFIRQEKPYFEERIDPSILYQVFVVEPQQSPERIRTQSAAFLVSAFHELFDRRDIRNWNSDIPVYANYRVTIPQEAKSNVLEDLALLNITQETMFPGLDSSAAAITRHYSGGS